MGDIPHGLKEAIENDELVLFIGAGLSWDLKNTKGKPLGGWKEMVSSMLSYLNKEDYITAEEQQSYDKLEPIGALTMNFQIALTFYFFEGRRARDLGRMICLSSYRTKGKKSCGR